IVPVDRRARIGVGAEPVAGRDDVGLWLTVEPRRPPRAVRRDLVVPARGGAVGVDGAHGDGGSRVAGRRDAGVSGLPGRRFKPTLPAATTTMMPARVARST